MENKTIYIPESKIEKDEMTVYGAGKFRDEKLVLNKTRAAFLLVELYKFLEKGK